MVTNHFKKKTATPERLEGSSEKIKKYFYALGLDFIKKML